MLVVLVLEILLVSVAAAAVAVVVAAVLTVVGGDLFVRHMVRYLLLRLTSEQNEQEMMSMITRHAAKITNIGIPAKIHR